MTAPTVDSVRARIAKAVAAQAAVVNAAQEVSAAIAKERETARIETAAQANKPQ